MSLRRMRCVFDLETMVDWADRNKKTFDFMSDSFSKQLDDQILPSALHFVEFFSSEQIVNF